ncbi:MAG: M48 family metalloprotease, partial [Atribacterota bacterium]
MKKNWNKINIIKNKNKVLKIFILVIFILLSIIVPAICTDRDFEKEEKIGRRMVKRVEKQYDLIEDSESLLRVQRIGDHLRNISGIGQINYQFNIIDREGPNAFAFPGGFIYITADLFDYIHSDDELAAIIAHEMGHVIHQHSIKQMQENRKMKLVELFAVLLTGDPTIGLLGELITITVLNNYRREYEEEADLTALELLNKSPIYHPVGLLTYFEKVGSEDLLKPNNNLGIFQTHPDVEERLKKVKQYLKENGININRRLTTDYLTVNGVYKKQVSGLLIARIFINDVEMFRFTGKEEEILCQKLEEIVLKFDQSLR